MNKFITNDHHTHIGRFWQTEYSYQSVFKALVNNGIKEIVCAYLTPKFSDKKDSQAFYDFVLQELKNAKDFAKKLNLKIHFLAWLDPLLFFSETELKEICDSFTYEGFALHPGLHSWTGSENKKLDIIFDYSKKTKMPLYIHTGISPYDTPLQFDRWFKNFPKVPVRLAHCKEAEPIIKLFSQYKNLTGDTAFCPADSYRAICNAGFKDRMYFGTDFPITHWYKKCTLHLKQ